MLSHSEVSTIFSRVLFRPASAGEITSWSAISSTTLDPCVQNAISQSLEALLFVDPIIRLYQGAFSRVPDLAGLSYWTNYLRTGNPISAVSSLFVSSPEFLDLYSTNLVTAALIEAFYFNVLRRSPTADEVNSLLALNLPAGVLLSDFTESPEFKTASLSQVNAFKADLITGLSPTGTLFSFS